MRIALFLNASAGEGVSRDSLIERIEGAGHEIVHVLEKDSELERALEGEWALGGDRRKALVVAAGGDGTVHRAAAAVAGKGVALAILPLGTANNIARSLGIEGALDDVIRGWATSRRSPFDFGRIESEGSPECFLEACGGGLLPAAIEAARELELHGSADSRVRRALGCCREALRRLSPFRCTLHADGERIEDELLLLEVLNTRFVGPRLLLSPASDTSDGLLELVMAGESHRSQLDDYLERRMEGGAPESIHLPTRRVRRVEIEGLCQAHVDDQVFSEPWDTSVSIRVEPAALELAL